VPLSGPKNALGRDLVLRDRFDWDLNDTKLRPVDFAKALVLSLPDQDDEGPDQKNDDGSSPKFSKWQSILVAKLTESIISQI